jgi:phosphate transport system permease protein
MGDRAFTVLALAPVFLIAVALFGILSPMVWRGAGAVFFQGTVEFRRMQMERYDRGSSAELEHELAARAEARRPAYEILDRFRRGIDTSGLEKEARQVFSRFTDELDYRDTPADTRRELRRRARRLRNDLVQAFETTDSAEALRFLDSVLASGSDPDLADTAAEGFFDLARRYRAIVAEVDLTRRREYAEALDEVQGAVTRLLGPRPEEPRPPLAQNQYGATRWDEALRHLDDILFAETWEIREPGQPMEKVRTPRSQQFAGTSLEPLFPLIEENLDEMLLPRFTSYWGYFVDDSTPGHFFGGAGPEILGTIVLTLLAILLAFPLGVISAAYLVEVAGDNWVVNLIRMCINTLAGVPSIVFGLFGLAFVVLWLFPRIGLRGEPCALAAAITLAVLILPVIIRASEEAIRAVPPTYKEASLALGASRFRCFVTVQLPAALPGILTGVILSMSRAAGETAPILFTGAVALGPVLELGGWPPLAWLFKPTRALSYGSYDIAVGDRLAALVPHQQFGMVMTLVGLVLLLNLTAIVIRSRISRKLRGQ